MPVCCCVSWLFRAFFFTNILAIKCQVVEKNSEATKPWRSGGPAFFWGATKILRQFVSAFDPLVSNKLWLSFVPRTPCRISLVMKQNAEFAENEQKPQPSFKPFLDQSSRNLRIISRTPRGFQRYSTIAYVTFGREDIRHWISRYQSVNQSTKSTLRRRKWHKTQQGQISLRSHRKTSIIGSFWSPSFLVAVTSQILNMHFQIALTSENDIRGRVWLSSVLRNPTVPNNKGI